jgi:hypothetical protein
VVSLTEADLPPAILTDARMRADFRRFRWFSSGWVASHPDRRAFIGDARYSLSTDRFDPVWGIRFRPSEEPPVEWVDYSRGRRVDPHALWAEIVGRDPTYGPLP